MAKEVDSARCPGRFTNAGHGTGRISGLSIQTAGLPSRPRAHFGQSGFFFTRCSRSCSAGVEVVVGREGGREREGAWHPPTSCWVPRGSDKAPVRLEQVVVNEILDDFREFPQKSITEVVDSLVWQVVKEILEEVRDMPHQCTSGKGQRDSRLLLRCSGSFRLCVSMLSTL